MGGERERGRRSLLDRRISFCFVFFLSILEILLPLLLLLLLLLLGFTQRGSVVKK